MTAFRGWLVVGLVLFLSACRGQDSDPVDGASGGNSVASAFVGEWELRLWGDQGAPYGVEGEAYLTLLPAGHSFGEADTIFGYASLDVDIMQPAAIEDWPWDSLVRDVASDGDSIGFSIGPCCDAGSLGFRGVLAGDTIRGTWRQEVLGISPRGGFIMIRPSLR